MRLTLKIEGENLIVRLSRPSADGDAYVIVTQAGISLDALADALNKRAMLAAALAKKGKGND